jgi:cell wall-associated NlpC family hydrolase
VIAVLAVAISGAGATAAPAAPSSDLTKQIEALTNKLEDITESYNAMNESLAKTIADEKALAASLPTARAALQTAGSQVAILAASAYKTGRVGPMTAILDGSAGMLDRMNYLDVISRDRQRDIKTYTATTQNYDQRQAALKTVQAKQAAQVKVLAATKSDIEGKLKTLRAKRTAAYGSPNGPSDNQPKEPIPNISGSAGKAVAYAIAAFNRHATYKYAHDGPMLYDCSGLTMASWRAAGKSLPHNAREQWGVVTHISRSAMKPGDLVFYRGLGHVGIFIGDGHIIAATSDGEPLKRQSVDVSPPYGFGRV